MKKKVAILTQKGSLSRDIQTDTKVNIFDIENEEVSGVEQIVLENTSNNYFSLLMALKKVSMVYVDSINSDLKNILLKIGITTKCKEDIINDKFINGFIFD
ncbi:hypothetical protein D0T53_04475 [Dysgonomonas sp. 216]|uniref:hypothetical protein n=1 Tax=Dysgonomonas sp. 216 TaxID=2302934 RepID=UPI0013D64F3E|nr:hypothetical protein [Dysgonomonas sp. 216]NDW18173.1 hypothetical protein [Dysgonomonas sp. 216]